MTYDLTKAMEQAAEVTKQQEEQNSNLGMKLVYPSEGVIKFRLLYNNKSGLIIRKIIRHKISNKQIVCLSNYGVECPICKALDNINNAKGSVPWQMKHTTRGIAYAEYVDSDYSWNGTNPNNIPSKGEIIMVMFPWSVYADLSRLFNSAGDKLEGLVASNVGGMFKVSRWVEKGQVKYRTEIDPFDTSHQTCKTDDEYFDLINNLPSLNDKFVPIKPTEEIVNTARDTANQLTAEYLGNSIIQPTDDPVSSTNYNELPKGQNLSSVAPSNNVGSNTESNIQSDVPECFGHHDDPSINPNQCLMCPSEVQCMSKS